MNSVAMHALTSNGTRCGLRMGSTVSFAATTDDADVTCPSCKTELDRVHSPEQWCTTDRPCTMCADRKRREGLQR